MEALTEETASQEGIPVDLIRKLAALGASLRKSGILPNGRRLTFNCRASKDPELLAPISELLATFFDELGEWAETNNGWEIAAHITADPLLDVGDYADFGFEAKPPHMQLDLTTLDRAKLTEFGIDPSVLDELTPHCPVTYDQGLSNCDLHR